jgi:hypothetical protein
MDWASEATHVGSSTGQFLLLSVQNGKQDKTNDEMLGCQSSRNRNANDQAPPHLSTFDEDGIGAHQGLMHPVLGNVCATNVMIKRGKVGMEDALKLGDMRA